MARLFELREPMMAERFPPCVQQKLLTVRDELPFDPIRPKKKNIRRDRLCPPQRRPGRPAGPFTVNRADIKQYDFHSSGEDDGPPSPLVSTAPCDYHTDDIMGSRLSGMVCLCVLSLRRRQPMRRTILMACLCSGGRRGVSICR